MDTGVKKKQMRILVYAPLGIGGVSNLMIDIQKSIDRKKLNFDYLVIHDQVEPQEQTVLDIGSNKIVASADEISYKPLRFVIRLFRIRKVCKENSISILHFNGGAPSGFFTMLFAKMGGVKWITFHSHNGGTYKKGIGSKIANMLCRPLLRFVVDDYWACSSIAANFSFPKKILKNHKYLFVPNGIDLERYKFNPLVRQNVRKEYGLEDKFVVGHAGRFNVQKNHEYLIEVFSKIHDKEENSILLLFGTGELENAIRDKVSLMGLNDCVRFCGASSEMNCMYQAMDVFIMPSLFEGLPVTGVEAQAAGLPILFSDTITKEVAFSTNIEYISLDDPVDKWADAALKYSKVLRRDYCKELEKNGFSKENMVEFFQSYYLDLGKAI